MVRALLAGTVPMEYYSNMNKLRQGLLERSDFKSKRGRV